MRSFAFGTPGIQELIIIFLILAVWGITIWGIIHCIKNKEISDTNRIIGVVLMAVLGPIGVVIYFLIPRVTGPPSDPDSDR